VAYFVAILTTYDYSDPAVAISIDGTYLHHLQTVGDPLNGQFLVSSGTDCIFEDLLVAGTDDTACFNFTIDGLQASRIYAYGCNSYGIASVAAFSQFDDVVIRGANYALSAGDKNTVYTDLSVYDVAAVTYVNDDHASIFFINPTIDTTSANGFYKYAEAGRLYIYNPTMTNITGENFKVYGGLYHDPGMYVIDSSGLQHSYYYAGSVNENTSEARSGSCLQYTPTYSATWLNYRHPKIKLGTFQVTDGATDVTLKVYMKDDASFNGTVKLHAESNFDRVVDFTEKTMTTSYVEQSITVPNANIATGDWVTLYAIISGSAGNVYADDFSASN
jgi:hypothetical protein